MSGKKRHLLEKRKLSKKKIISDAPANKKIKLSNINKKSLLQSLIQFPRKKRKKRDRKDYQKKYREENKQKIKEYNENYNEKHPRKEYHKNYYQKNKKKNQYVGDKNKDENEQIYYDRWKIVKKLDKEIQTYWNNSEYLKSIQDHQKDIDKHYDKLNHIDTIIFGTTHTPMIFNDLKSELDDVRNHLKRNINEYVPWYKQTVRQINELNEKSDKKCKEIKKAVDSEHEQCPQSYDRYLYRTSSAEDKFDKMIVDICWIRRKQIRYLVDIEKRINKHAQVLRILLQRLKIKLKQYDLDEINSISDEDVSNCYYYNWRDDTCHIPNNFKHPALAEWIYRE